MRRRFGVLLGALMQCAMVLPCAGQAARDDATTQYTPTLAMSVRTSKAPASVVDGDMTIRVRGGLARVDYSLGTPGMPAGTFLLFDGARTGTTLVIPAQKAFIVLDSSMASGVLAQASEMLRPRYSAITAHRDSVGAGETILGFSSRKFRMGMGITMDVGGSDFSMSIRTETEVEMHVSEEVAALAPGFGGLGRSSSVGNPATSFTTGLGSLFSGDSAVLRAAASMAPPRGFPVLQVSTQRSIMGGDTTTTTSSMRLKAFERGAVAADVFSVPAGFTATDMMSMARTQMNARPPQ